MKHLIFAAAIIGAGLLSQAAGAAAPAECFANSGAVFAAHPNAVHASYLARGKRSGGSGRCWFADAFKTEAKADPKPAPRPVAMVAGTSAPPAIKAPVPSLRTTAAAPAPRPRTMAAAPASPRVIAQFPSGVPPAIQIAVNVKALNSLLQVDDAPADFESRFSASGYKVRKYDAVLPGEN